MGVIKSKMGTIGSKMGRKFEQKKKAKWVKKKNLVKAYWTRCTQTVSDASVPEWHSGAKADHPRIKKKT